MRLGGVDSLYVQNDGMIAPTPLGKGGFEQGSMLPCSPGVCGRPPVRAPTQCVDGDVPRSALGRDVWRWRVVHN